MSFDVDKQLKNEAKDLLRKIHPEKSESWAYLWLVERENEYGKFRCSYHYFDSQERETFEFVFQRKAIMFRNEVK